MPEVPLSLDFEVPELLFAALPVVEESFDLEESLFAAFPVVSLSLLVSLSLDLSPESFGESFGVDDGIEPGVVVDPLGLLPDFEELPPWSK